MEDNIVPEVVPMNNIELSILIPAYNEAGRIGPTLIMVDRYIKSLGITYEIIVVDDGSTDGMVEQVEDVRKSIDNIALIKNEVNRGKGYSVRKGFLGASGRLVLFSDADLSTPIEEFGKLLREIEKGADIVIGSRAMKGSVIYEKQPFYRRLMGKAFNKIVRILAIGGFSDTQCGFKLFRAERCRQVFMLQKIDRFAFDVELIMLGVKKGLYVREVPVEWHNSPESKVRILKDTVRMFRDIIIIRLNILSDGYDGL